MFGESFQRIPQRLGLVGADRAVLGETVDVLVDRLEEAGYRRRELETIAVEAERSGDLVVDDAAPKRNSPPSKGSMNPKAQS